MRRPIIVANWKMNKTAHEARDFVRALLAQLREAEPAEIAIAPPATALEAVAEAIAGSEIRLAAQNVHAEPNGAFTGEIAASMLAEFGCRYAIVGHSERRTLFGESSKQVARKTATLLASGISPIVCVGETLEQREAHETFAVMGAQVAESLSGITPDEASRMVVAYEPIWAIGTGRTATPEMAEEVHAFIRERLCARFGASGERIRIQYGGSVKPENVAAIMAQPNIDGALVGGASLDPARFAHIAAFDRAPERQEKTTS